MSNTSRDPNHVYRDPHSSHLQSSRYDSIGNRPAIATPDSTTTSWQQPRKRKTKDERYHYHEYSKRPRQGTTQETLVPLRETSNSGQSYSATQQGTQHIPIEIESSPEQKSGKRSCIPPSTPRQNPASFKDYIREPDPAVKWPVYYAVARGRVPGLYLDWPAARDQVSGYSGGRQKKFKRQEDAWDFMNEHSRHVKRVLLCPNETIEGLPKTQPAQHECMADQIPMSSPPDVDTHTHIHAALISSWENISQPEESASQQFIVEQQQPVGAAQSHSIPAGDFVPEPEIELSAEQRYVVDLIVEGGHNVFYTGSAGCGKSTVLKAFVSKLKARGKCVNIVAPTNLAALNVGGQTTWAYAGWTPDSLKLPLDKLKADAHKKKAWQRFESTDVLVIDEISMVENLQFERLNEIMKASLGEKRRGPFGGVQIIVTGDFCQLSPVKPFAYCMGCGWELIHERKDGQLRHRCENKGCRYDVWQDTDKWAFRSNAWKECNFKHVNLTQVFRQTDYGFKAILQRIRTDGVILPHHAKVLLNHSSETQNAIKIYSLRRDVDRVNNENIRRLPSASRIYRCLDNFECREHHWDDDSLERYRMPGINGSDTLHALKEHRYEACIELKEGMLVVLQSNLDPQSNLVNGAQGTIVGFELYDPTKLPSAASGRPSGEGKRNAYLKGPHADYAERQIFEYAEENHHPSWPIVEFGFDDRKTRRTIYADCSYSEHGNEEKRLQEGQPRQQPSLLSRTQVPLVAGYAITVHKSQGMTLNRVIVDLSAAFEASQIYVALSRARSLKGLKVLGLPQKHLGGANKQVKEFLETCIEPRKLLSGTALPSSQVSYSQLPSSSQVVPSQPSSPPLWL